VYAKCRRYHRVLKNFTLFVFIAITSLFLLMLGVFRKKSRVPSSIVYSLTSEQVFTDKGIEDQFTSLNEERFQDFFGVSNLLIEVRSIKSLLTRNKMITIDAPFFLLTRCIKKNHYRSFLSKVFRSVIVMRIQELSSLKEVKKSVFDIAVYEVLHQHRYPEFDLVTTNSSLKKLPFAFECPGRGRRIMVWYSTNSKPMYFRGKRQRLNWNISAIKKGLDSHLVWTKHDVAFLESLGIHNAHAIGPILLQKPVLAERSNDKYVITYFDVTPLAPTNNWIIGTQENFYSEQDALGDLEAIITLSDDLMRTFDNKVEVRIKPKRAYSSMHSRRYIMKLIESCREYGIELMSPDSNLYEVVSQSDLVIATPWTSPAVLAKEMSLNSIFFAIRVADWYLPSSHEDIRVIKSLRELTTYVKRGIQKKFNKSTS
jgi:polysaccharide biosynthesis PFTS motif protein